MSNKRRVGRPPIHGVPGRLNISCDRDLYVTVRDLADAVDESISVVARRLIERGLRSE